MDRAREVVITGIGVVSPIGIGRDAFWRSLCEGCSGVRRLSLFNDGADLPFRIGADVADFQPKQYVKPRKSLKVMCREIQFGFVAADLAMEDAALGAGSVDPDRLGVVLGSEMFYCNIEELEEVYRHCLDDGRFNFGAWGQRAMSDVYPLWMLKHLPNMVACHVGIAHDARGPNNTITLGEASSLLAIGESVAIIRRGQADVMIAGGAGARINLTTMVYRGLVDMSPRVDHPETISRPFDANRDGMVIGEGAGAVVLESRRHAEARGATIMASVAGQSSTFATNANGQAEAAVAGSIRLALRSAGLEASQVGHVNAHGLSTTVADRVEAQAIRSVLGDVPVTAPKSFFGNLGAGGGAVELAASVLALAEDKVPVTLNYKTPDPECPVNIIHTQAYRPRQQAAVVLNQSPTGQAVAIVLASP